MLAGVIWSSQRGRICHSPVCAGSDDLQGVRCAMGLYGAHCHERLRTHTQSMLLSAQMQTCSQVLGAVSTSRTRRAFAGGFSCRPAWLPPLAMSHLPYVARTGGRATRRRLEFHAADAHCAMGRGSSVVDHHWRRGSHDALLGQRPNMLAQLRVTTTVCDLLAQLDWQADINTGGLRFPHWISFCRTT